jgi:hypothetical protein
MGRKGATRSGTTERWPPDHQATRSPRKSAGHSITAPQFLGEKKCGPLDHGATISRPLDHGPFDRGQKGAGLSIAGKKGAGLSITAKRCGPFDRGQKRCGPLDHRARDLLRGERFGNSGYQLRRRWSGLVVGINVGKANNAAFIAKKHRRDCKLAVFFAGVLAKVNAVTR